MNIEIRRRVDPLLPHFSSGVNDNTEERPQVPRRRVIIFKPARAATTSGRARTKQWLLEFEPRSGPFIEPLMGWTGSTDPMANMQLAFGSREAAIAYAERQNLEYEVREPAQPDRPAACERRADHQSTSIHTAMAPVGGGTSITIDLAA
ncbi:MAG TPA: ETC complex I subunit [Stellaceae bacterium]|nr:ETC complex I subunit [Stellaceae bacterium]